MQFKTKNTVSHNNDARFNNVQYQLIVPTLLAHLLSKTEILTDHTKSIEKIINSHINQQTSPILKTLDVEVIKGQLIISLEIYKELLQCDRTPPSQSLDGATASAKGMNYKHMPDL